VPRIFRINVNILFICLGAQAPCMNAITKYRLLRHQCSSLLVRQDDVLHRVLLVFEVLRIEVGVGREEELCVTQQSAAEAMNVIDTVSYLDSSRSLAKT